MFEDKKLIKGMAALLAVLMLAASISGCSGCNGKPDEPAPTEAVVDIDDTPVPTEVITPEPTATPDITVERKGLGGFVAACATGSFGVASDGSVRFMGRTVSGQNLVNDWNNIVSIAASDDAVAGLKADGGIVYADNKGTIPFLNTALWKDIVDIALGSRHFVGLKADGRVVATGDNTDGQLNVSEWWGVTKIGAAGYYTAALTGNGLKTTLGEEFDAKFEGLDILDFAAAKDHIAVLLSDGTVRSFAVETGEFSGGAFAPVTDEVYDWTDIIKITAAERGATYAVDKDGVLHTNTEYLTESVENVYLVAAGRSHCVVLHGDGTCEGFGENEDMQTAVDGWRLLPFVTDEGWLLGMTLGAEVDGEIVRTGREMTYTDPVSGVSRTVTCVVLGDVDGDGDVDNDDVEAVNRHTKGTEQLKGAYLRAANVIVDGDKPGSIDVSDTDLITAQASGWGNVIDQYAKTDMYTDLLAKARRINPDATGYINVPGTTISYPILYGENWYYNDHGIHKNQTNGGSIYYYWAKASRNIVITGHNNRKSGSMFHQLHDVQDRGEELATYANRLWYINAYGKSGWWEVWALYEEPAFAKPSDSSQYYNTCWPNGFNVLTDAEKQAWIEYQIERTELTYTVDVVTGERFMTLLTCSDQHSDSKLGARLYIFLRFVGSN